MLKRVAYLVATGASLAALLLGGCGRQLPVTAAYRTASSSGVMAQANPSLSALTREAMTLIRKAYPNSRLYEVNGARNNSPMNDANDFDSWSFVATDDASQPKNTVSVVYQGGKFGAPVRRSGIDYGRQLADLSPRVDLPQAIALVHQAAFKQDFRYVDLYRVINPNLTEPYYIFTSDSAIVTVGAQTGQVAQYNPGAWLGNN